MKNIKKSLFAIGIIALFICISCLPVNANNNEVKPITSTGKIQVYAYCWAGESLSGAPIYRGVTSLVKVKSEDGTISVTSFTIGWQLGGHRTFRNLPLGHTYTITARSFFKCKSATVTLTSEKPYAYIKLEF